MSDRRWHGPARRAALALLACVAFAGCGGGDESKVTGDPQIEHGRELFAQRCAGCHTLSAARAEGSATDEDARERVDAPNLDERRVSEDDVLFAIRNGGFGGSIMPANLVTGEDARAVARFVARYAGAKAPEEPDETLEEDPLVGGMEATRAGAAAGTLPRAASVADEGFLRAAFDSAQALWQRKFTAAGARYQPAKLVFFDSEIDTPCGRQTPATGPFYCPAAHGVYLNTGFFRALAARHGIQGPFAAGYVTAHEIGHHVQQLLGLHARVAMANASSPGGANARSVRVELQADCYAGVWLHSVARAGELGNDDVRDILTAAAVVGDDFQRNQAGKELAPETWTHGSSRQRVHWVTTGKRSGLPGDCDTFDAG